MRRSLVLVALPALVAGSLLAALPAQAATVSLYGTTVDVVTAASGDSIINETAYDLSSGSAVVATLGAAQASDVLFQLFEGATLLADCTITTGNTVCGNGLGDLTPGAHAVTLVFTKSAVPTTFSGTIFSVLNVAPTVTVEWQDASGAWVDGSAAGTPMLGESTGRCVVTNNSNVAFAFAGFTVTGSDLDGPFGQTITGTLAAGATGYYEVWTGASTLSPGFSCGGTVEFPDGTTNGGGTGGGLLGVGGSITISPTPAPGKTVTVSGESLTPPFVPELEITLDGVEVPDSPVTISGPDFDFAAAVVIPANLAPGIHTIQVAVYDGERRIVYAQFAFEVPKPALAATGVDVLPLTLFGMLVLSLGAALLLTRRRAA